MSERVVHPSAGIGGRLAVPGDKSITHRAILLSALAEGESRIRGHLRSEDCLRTLEAVRALGAGVCEMPDGTLLIRGAGGRLRCPDRPLDMGNSGTGIRLLCGVLAGQPFTAELTGDASLRSRPMGRIRKPLEAMGARLEMLGGEGERAPLRVTGGRLRGIAYEMPVPSAQVKSCVLLAGLFAEGTTSVREPQPTRDHTERMLRALGAGVDVAADVVAVRGAGPGLPALPAREWDVPGDFSSAAFWMAAAAGRPGQEARITGVGVNPRRTAFLDVLRRMGAEVEVLPANGGGGWEPRGEVRVRGGVRRGTEIGGAEVANLIDELPAAAVLAALAPGETVIRDAAELRVKESDRIATVAAGLRAMGVECSERPDGMTVRGGRAIRGGAAIETRGDHRIAMAFSVLALYADRPVTIRDAEWTSTSYPGFWEQLEAFAGGAGRD